MRKLVASAVFGVVIFLASLPAVATLLTVPVGAAQATLQLVPDPPRVGKAHAVVTLSGASTDALAHTTASFATMMPSMSMGGPGGSAKMTAPGRYEFDAILTMAAGWDISIQFAGGVSGTATYHVAVGSGARGSTSDASKAMSGTPSNSAPGNSANSSGMSGMAGMSASGDPGAWRTATFALVVILLIGLTVVLLVRRDRRPLTLGITITAALITLVLATVQARYATAPMDMAAMSTVRGQAPTPVTLAVVGGSQNQSDVFAPGTIAPYFTQDIVTRAPGILRQFNAYAGDRVQAGQVIAILDAPDLQSRAAAATADAAAQAASAQAAAIEAQHHAPNGVIIANAQTSAMERDLSAARAERTAKAEQLRYWQSEILREKTLLDQGAVSQQEYQDERAQAAAAQAASDGSAQRVASLEQQVLGSRTKALDAVASVRQMQAQAAAAQAQAIRAQANARTESTLAGYTTVASPSNATVMKRLVDPGVYVAAGTPIVRIAVVDRLRVQANVAQRDLEGITEGTLIEAKLADGTVVHGRVTSVSPVADPTSHTAVVEAVVANSRTHLVPGGFVRVTLRARAQRVVGGIQVPSSAIVGSGADAAVWASVNSAAHRVPVNVVSDNGILATVTGGLARGTHVVVDGAPTLEEGQALAEQRP